MDSTSCRWWKLARSSKGADSTQVKEQHFRFFVASVNEDPVNFAEFIELCRKERFPEEGLDTGDTGDTGDGEGDVKPEHLEPPLEPLEDSYCEADRSVHATKRCNTLAKPYVCITRESFRYVISL
mmetsp:Transcript_69226/g.109247  ORF Transcript_69226/g.109247 Transcript_69226/m.109247 type:complete len:125 (-) Transcript_69226:123-497(-)